MNQAEGKEEEEKRSSTEVVSVSGTGSSPTCRGEGGGEDKLPTKGKIPDFAVPSIEFIRKHKGFHEGGFQQCSTTLFERICCALDQTETAAI